TNRVDHILRMNDQFYRLTHRQTHFGGADIIMTFRIIKINSQAVTGRFVVEFVILFTEDAVLTGVADIPSELVAGNFNDVRIFRRITCDLEPEFQSDYDQYS